MQRAINCGEPLSPHYTILLIENQLSRQSIMWAFHLVNLGGKSSKIESSKMLIYKRGYIQNITSFFCHQQTSTKYWQFINLKTKGNKRAMALLYTCVDMGNKSVTRFWQPLRPPQISNMTSGLKSLTLITTYPCAYC